VLQRLPKLLIAVALASSIGLHWGFLQSFAWTTMLVDNLTTNSFCVALQRTFDGKHPCHLCKAVAEGKKSEKKSDILLPLKKLEAFNQSVTFVLSPPASFPGIEAPNALLETLADAPPTPPPRAA
jgi:hypothetical protein